jgi:hypothetical protein
MFHRRVVTRRRRRRRRRRSEVEGSPSYIVSPQAVRRTVVHSASSLNCPNARPPYGSAHRPDSLLHLAVLYMQTPFSRKLPDSAHTAPSEQPRRRGSRSQPRHLSLEWGERTKLFTACQRILHACPAVIILALREWLWRRGKTGRAIAALAEREKDRERRACAWPFCTGSSFGRRLPLDYITALTRAAAAGLLSLGEVEPYRLVTRRCILPHH